MPLKFASYKSSLKIAKSGSAVVAVRVDVSAFLLENGVGDDGRGEPGRALFVVFLLITVLLQWSLVLVLVAAFDARLLSFRVGVRFGA